jgi:hypothetical protein
MHLSSDQLGVLVPSSLLNTWHVARWPHQRAGEAAIVEQDFRVVAADRPDLFPAWGSTAFRLDLGGVIVFVRSPVQ